MIEITRGPKLNNAYLYPSAYKRAIIEEAGVILRQNFGVDNQAAALAHPLYAKEVRYSLPYIYDRAKRLVRGMEPKSFVEWLAEDIRKRGTVRRFKRLSTFLSVDGC